MKFTIIGSGAFGTSIANVLADSKANSEVIIYGIDDSEVNDINQNSHNTRYFSTPLNKKIFATTNLKNAIEDTDYIILAIPSKSIYQFLSKSLLPILKSKVNFISVIKGFALPEEKYILSFLEEIIPSENLNSLFFLTGPSFAQEIVEKNPTSFVIASKDSGKLLELKSALATDYTIIKTTTDVDGAQFASIFKNIIAIIIGIIEGKKFGMNTKSLFLTLGYQEMSKIGKELSYDHETFETFAGIGDLVLTSLSHKSRNFQFGYLIGLENKVTNDSGTTIEGVQSLVIMRNIAKRLKVSCRMLDFLWNILNCKVIDFNKEIKNLFKNYQ